VGRSNQIESRLFRQKFGYEKICGQWVRKKNNLGTKTNLSTKKKGTNKIKVRKTIWVRKKWVRIKN